MSCLAPRTSLSPAEKNLRAIEAKMKDCEESSDEYKKLAQEAEELRKAIDEADNKCENLTATSDKGWEFAISDKLSIPFYHWGGDD
jgi:uncharacterized coiled-coil DUF342 family protein